MFAREAVFFAARGAEITAEQLSGDTADRLWFYFSKVRDSINDGTNVYTVLKTKEGNLKDFCFCDITQYGALMVTKASSRQVFFWTISMRRGTPFQE